MYDNLTRTNLEFAYREAEKRIAELEKACDETQKLLDKQIEVTYKLVEENTELKERNKELLESCEGATMMYKDLCKAKEIITKLVERIRIISDPKICMSDVDVLLEAEQFLR